MRRVERREPRNPHEHLGGEDWLTAVHQHRTARDHPQHGRRQPQQEAQPGHDRPHEQPAGQSVQHRSTKIGFASRHKSSNGFACPMRCGHRRTLGRRGERAVFRRPAVL
ncbi:hypothetical protein [Amycolatopsis plumensis]|uniref:hypothetical protein n=1 Tax=Amycolatopsis plumensis TaxID=236508 RepID=UPI00361F80D8